MLVTFEEARACTEEQAAKVAATTTEIVSLDESRGRVLAASIYADRDFPPFRRATRDGYALRSNDLTTIPTSLRMVGQVKAGENFPRSLATGECVEIMTGAPAPEGADAVIMVENTSATGDVIEVRQRVSPGENIVPTGAEGKAGDVAIAAGIRMTFREIATAAAIGKRELKVFARPKIAILSTGDEIVDLNSSPGPFQIRNSNAHSIAALVQAAGGSPRILPIAPDEKNKLRDLISQGLKADLLLISGGVSMGKYDLVEEVLSEFAAEFFFTGAKIQPGKPVVFGRAMHSEKQTYFVGLPGNPVSTMVCFELFAGLLIESFTGCSTSRLNFAQARLKVPFKTRTGLMRFLPARLSGSYNHPQVELIGWQGSADIQAMTRSNCYLVVPPERDSYAAGDLVSVLIPRYA